MTAQVPRFPLPAQAPIRLAAPAVDPGINWTLIVALALNFGIWAVILITAWRFFHA